MTKSRWQQYKEKNGVTPLDLLNPKTIKASEEVASARYETCLSCPDLTHHTKQCKHCGCFMIVKSALAEAKCPIGKW